MINIRAMMTHKFRWSLHEELSYVAENLKRKLRQSLKKTKNMGLCKTADSNW